MSSRFKPPLTRDHLVDIQERNKDNPDVVALLWEIKRLRAVVLHADQLQRSLGDMGGGTGLVLSALRNQLTDEPCVKESLRLDMNK
jgi:hypothetical protein